MDIIEEGMNRIEAFLHVNTQSNERTECDVSMWLSNGYYKSLLEGEFGADPLWCAVCQYNIELDDMPIDERLKDELLYWANAFGQWVELEESQFVEGGKELEQAHNASGRELANKVATSLGQGYTVKFVASAM